MAGCHLGHGYPEIGPYRGRERHAHGGGAEIERKPDPAQGATEIEEGEGRYKFKIAKQPSDGFSVQIGVYSEYGNVLQKAAKVQDRFDEQMIVHIARVNEKTVYKIMINLYIVSCS